MKSILNHTIVNSPYLNSAILCPKTGRRNNESEWKVQK